VFLVVLHPFTHREPVSRTVLADLLSREVLHVISGVLLGSIVESYYLEHESLLVVVPLSDEVVQDRINRFTCR